MAISDRQADADENLVLRIERTLARWDGDGDETYRELSIRLLRLIRMKDEKNISEKTI